MEKKPSYDLNCAEVTQIGFSKTRSNEKGNENPINIKHFCQDLLMLLLAFLLLDILPQTLYLLDP